MPAKEACPICGHDKSTEINRDVVIRQMNITDVAKKYNVSRMAVHRHRPHITLQLAAAQARREDSASDRLLDDVEMLWNETKQAMEDSKSAVKTMAVTEEIEYTKKDGSTGRKMVTHNKEYRDIGALLSAIKVAHENRRLFGDSSGAIKPHGVGGQVGIYLSIGMPRLDDAPSAIEAPFDSVLNTPENEDSQVIENKEEVEIEAPPEKTQKLLRVTPKRLKKMIPKLSKAEIKAKIWGDKLHHKK